MKLRLALFVAIILSSCSCVNAQPAPAQTLITTIDCTAEFPADTYFGHGDVKVVDSPLGKYREAEGKPLSRFGYRFQIKNIDRPHLIVVKYPDDKRRMMCMMEGTCYDMTEGAFTDFNQPLSNQMLEIRRVFWPRWKDYSVVFMTWSTGEPAAAAKIEVYELSDLPTLPINSPADATPRRAFGSQFEDPCGRGMSLGARTSEQWQDRMIEYMRYTGQNLLTYPMVWYHGPHYPSTVEPCQELGCAVGDERKMYAISTTQPSDWVADMLKKFEKENLQFKAAMTLLRLGSLMKTMNIDLPSIQAGKETYNNMRADDRVQDGTQDWTPQYNTVEPAVDPAKNIWAYGERGQTCSKGPMFNPLHPRVQQAILNLVKEIATKYGASPAFKGLSLNMWHATICWFGTPEIGYDDYTIALFTKETGIEVPGEPTDAKRFSKRYDYLMKNHRDRWLGWRCVKIADLFRKMRDTIVAARPDLTLNVSLWTETTMSQLLGVPDGPEYQLFARISTYDIYREGGFDAKLLENEPGISIDYVFVPSRDRDDWGHDGLEMPLEKLSMFHDHDFLDEATLSMLKNTRSPSAFVFDSWVEAWGEFKGFPCEANDPQVKQFAQAWSVPAERISHMNSEYPKDGFWWKWQFRITPQFPAGVHYMEHFAHALAEYDALEITRGGLFMDTGHADLMRPFAAAYRTLPAKKFDTVGDSTDPVAVRTLNLDGKTYLYLVNREYYPVNVAVELAGKSAVTPVDLTTGKNITLPQGNWPITLGAYQLSAYTLPADAKATGFTAAIPGEIESQLIQRARQSLQRIDQLKGRQAKLPIGTDRIAPMIESDLAKKHYSHLRHLLDSYIARKIDQLWDKKDSEPKNGEKK